MFVQELFGQVPVFINGEEKDILALYEFTEKLYRRELNERQQHIANGLVNKNVLLRKKDAEKKLTYFVKTPND